MFTILILSGCATGTRPGMSFFRGPQQHRDRTGAPGRSRTRLGPSAGHARLLDAGPGSSFRTVMVMVHNGDCAASAERGLGARPVYKKCPLCKNAVSNELRLATRRENGQNHGNFNAIAFCGAVPSRSGHRTAGYHRSCGRLRPDTFYRSSGPPDVSLCVVRGLCRNALRANIAQQARHFSGGLRGYHGGMHGGSGPLLWVRGPQIVLIKRHMPCLATTLYTAAGTGNAMKPRPKWSKLLRHWPSERRCPIFHICESHY